MDRRETAQRGEDAAAAFLERAGLTIAERNWRCSSGEIDIIALEDTTLVFVEVKTRRTASCGSPEEAVSPTKQRRLARCARAYVALNQLGECDIRFDVIAILPLAEDRALLRHHRAAFMTS